MPDGDNFLDQHLEYIGKHLYGTLGTYTHWPQAALESGAHFTFHENHNDSNNCIAIMSRVSKNEFKHIIHPNAILPVRINRQVISSTTKSAVLAFIFLYMAIIFIGWLVLMLFGVGFEEAYSVVISSLGNVGPGIGKCGPSYSWSGLPDAAKWTSAILMLIGRLELFTVLLLFMPSFWKKH
jgi:trk system potassium uptake protein